MKGYMGKILYIDLSLSKKEVRDLDVDGAKKYIGGSGLGTKILFDETDKDTDPLGAENILIFLTGPFTGTPVPCSSRYSVVSKSTFIKWYKYVTGKELDVDSFMKTGERMFNLKRLYNVNCDVSRKDDFLPPRILTWKKVGKGLSPNLPPLGTMLGEYYEYRGWSEDGIPSKEKMEELEIG